MLTPEDERAIARKMVDDLYDQAPTIIGGSLVLYAINGAVYWGRLPDAAMLVCTLLFVLATGARTAAWIIRRRDAERGTTAFWRRLKVGIHATLGLCWSSLAVAAMVHLDPAVGAIAVINVAGVLGSSVATAAASTAAFRAIAMTGLVPIAVVGLLHDHVAYRAMGAMALAYILVISAASRKVHGTLRRSLEVAQLNRSLVRALEQLSSTDPLTQLLNRRGLDAAIEALQCDERLAGRPAGVVFCDIDHFKRYNDALGHLAGDECLRSVARALQGCVRNEDILGRFGGEEFAALILDCNEDQLEAAAYRMCDAVRRCGIAHPDSPIADHVTLSAGAALLPEGALSRSQELFDAADRALYVAKRDGRDGYAIEGAAAPGGLGA